MNQVKLDPRSEWGCRSHNAEYLWALFGLSHCPVTFFMFLPPPTCCQLLTFQVAGSADSRVRGDPGEWAGTRGGNQGSACSSSLYHCPDQLDVGFLHLGVPEP